MSTKAARACLYLAITSMAALAICPVAGAEPDRQCYQTQTGIACIDVSADRTTPTQNPVPVPLPSGEWGVAIPKEKWPPPNSGSQGSAPLPGGQQGAPLPEGKKPEGSPKLPNWTGW